ncbi:tetratricopeptide repeat protein [Gloeobacter morelensis]|uniref:Tetratricopeptide repeat protein n=1 Tax=Gloeobacter morelensis MG652769 TaxID=2781736 RepID=A0ABY3PLE6_9CYAN|nr:tetratricopeptide repeat protein [Gloeobacter morelensis]UFP94398.1 tetratricopeptide repeat protein [Gloeobacter morelensis MG652769]
MKHSLIIWFAGLFVWVSPAVYAHSSQRTEDGPTPVHLAQVGIGRYEAQQRFNEAGAKAERGDYAGAIADYSEAIRLYPQYYQALGKRADTRLKMDDLQGAVADYKAMLRVYPNDIGVYHNLAKAYFTLKNYPDTVIYTGEALNRNPGMIDVRQLRARALVRQGEFARAVADYNEILQNQPEEAAVLALRARAYQRLGDYTRAFDDFSAALQLNPKLADIYAYRAAMRLDQGSNLAALEDGDQAIKQGEKTALIYFVQGNARFNLGQAAQAEAAYREGEALPFGQAGDPDDFDYKLRADARLNQKRYKEALADYTEALKLNPSYPEAYFKRGNLRVTIEDRAGAISDLRQARQLFAGRGDTLNAKRAETLLVKLQAAPTS